MAQRNEFQDPPDPEFSPIEKLVTARRFQPEISIKSYLQAQGLDPDLVERIGAALDNWDRDKEFVRQEQIRELEAWANIHTHDGFAGSALLAPYAVPPYRMYETNGTYQISWDHGRTWEPGNQTGTFFNDRSKLRYIPKLTDTTGYIIRVLSYRWQIETWDDSNNALGHVNLRGSVNNGDVLDGVSVVPESGLAVACGGASGGAGRIFYNGTRNFLTDADWTEIIMGAGAFSSITYVPEGDYFFVTGWNTADQWRSTQGDHTDWTQMAPVDDRLYWVEAHRGDLYAFTTDRASVSNNWEVIKSIDGGSTWEKVLELSVARPTELYSNGEYLFLCTSEGLFVTDGDSDFATVPFFGTDKVTTISWDGTTWYVGYVPPSTNQGEVYVTEDSTAQSGWVLEKSETVSLGNSI